MNKMANLVFEATKNFEEYTLKVFAQQMSAQPLDVKTAVAPALGLKSKGGGEFEFDVNSKAADVIFNAMEAAGYQGEIHIELSVDSKKTGKLIITANPSNKQSTAAIQKITAGLTTGVNNALKNMKSAPADTISIQDIVTAANV